jgi:hypothetical protein
MVAEYVQAGTHPQGDGPAALVPGATLLRGDRDAIWEPPGTDSRSGR